MLLGEVSILIWAIYSEWLMLLPVHLAAVVIFGLLTSYSSSSLHNTLAFYDCAQDSLQPAYVNRLILHQRKVYPAVELRQKYCLAASGNLGQ